MKRLMFLSWLLLAPLAHASISEIYLSYPNQTAALPATPILTAGPSVGSYLVCVYLEQTSTNSITATLTWTDDNNLQHSVSPLRQLDIGWSAMCQPIRNQANTAPTISTSGIPTYPYGVYVVGFGFWTTGSQKQGGLSIPVSYLGWPVGQSTLLTTAKEATYLLTIQTLTPGTGIGDILVEWSDHEGLEWMRTNNSQQTAVIPIHALANTFMYVYGTADPSPGSTTQFTLVQFGTPANGNGPLLDYEANLLDWTNATYPYAKTLFTQGTSSGFGLIAANVTVANQGGTAECVNAWSGTTLAAQAVCSDADSTYGSLLLPMAVAGDAAVNYWTTNATYPYSGASPNYNAEVDAIVFTGIPAADRHRRRVGDDQRPGD